MYSCATATTTVVCANGFYATSTSACAAYSITALANCAYGTPASSTTSPTVCSFCNLGYTLNTASLCVACIDTNANTCVQLSTTTSFSLSCKQGYFLSNGVCKTFAGYAAFTTVATYGNAPT
jgi:hypothetical protein